MKLLLSTVVAVWTALSLGGAYGFVQQNSEVRIPTLLGYLYSSSMPFGDNAPNHQPGGGYRYSPSPEWEYLGSSIDRDAINRLRPNNVPMPSGTQAAPQNGIGAGMPKPAFTYGYTPCSPIGDNAAALARNFAHVAPSWEYQGPARNGQVSSIAEASRMLGDSSAGAALLPSTGRNNPSTQFGGGALGGALRASSTQSTTFGSGSGGGFGSSTTTGTPGSAGSMSSIAGATQSSPFGSSGGGSSFGSTPPAGTPGSTGGGMGGSTSSSSGSTSTGGIPGSTGGGWGS